MPDRPRFRIMDLVVAVAAAGVGFGGVGFIEGNDNRAGVVATIFLMTVAAYAAFTYYVARFARRRSTQLLTLAVALGFAAATIGVYSAIYMRESFLPVAGLMAVALVLAVGGVMHGLLDHRHELKDQTETTPADSHPTPHPLDRELIP